MLEKSLESKVTWFCSPTFSVFLVWCFFFARLFLRITGLMDAMVTVTWRRKAVIAAAMIVGIRLYRGVQHSDVFSPDGRRKLGIFITSFHLFNPFLFSWKHSELFKRYRKLY